MPYSPFSGSLSPRILEIIVRITVMATGYRHPLEVPTPVVSSTRSPH
jgi:hypothetical protein